MYTTAKLNLGQRVVVKGLTGAKQLNGKCGTILHFDENKCRYAVALDEEDSGKLIQPENLDVVQGTQREAWKAIFASEPATPKLKRLAQTGALAPCTNL